MVVCGIYAVDSAAPCMLVSLADLSSVLFVRYVWGDGLGLFANSLTINLPIQEPCIRSIVIWLNALQN